MTNTVSKLPAINPTSILFTIIVSFLELRANASLIPLEAPVVDAVFPFWVCDFLTSLYLHVVLMLASESRLNTTWISIAPSSDACLTASEELLEQLELEHSQRDLAQTPLDKMAAGVQAEIGKV